MRGIQFWKLVGHEPVRCGIDGFAGPARVAHTEIGRPVKQDGMPGSNVIPLTPIWVSTVFLGLDHRHFGDGPPILFETMVFGGAFNGRQRRCCTWDEAEVEHAATVAMIEADFKEKAG